MPNLCHRCQMSFTSWTDYHEHESLGNCIKALETQAEALPEHSTGLRQINYAGPFVKGRWKGPQDNMPKNMKRRIVAQGEKRIGYEYFFGGNYVD